MARDTLNHTIDELYTLLTSNQPTAVAAVYDHEPASGQMAKPAAITVSGAGQTNDTFLVRVRIYVDDTVDVRSAERTRNDIAGDIDVLMAAHWGPVGWGHTRADTLNALTAETIVSVGREDGHLRFSPRGEDTFS